MLCCVEGCRHYSTKKNDSKIFERSEMKKVVFYVFPKEASLRRQWISFCGKPLTWKAGIARICSDHFCPDGYEGYGFDNHQILKKDAVPSKKEVTVETESWKVVIPSKERNICNQELRKHKQLTLPQLKDDLQESGIDKSGEAQLDNSDYGGMNISNTVDKEHCPSGETCFQIVCTVTNSTAENPTRVSSATPVPSTSTVSFIKESESKVSIMKRPTVSSVATGYRKKEKQKDQRDDLYIPISEHLSQIKELKKTKNTLARRYTASQKHLLHSNKQVDNLEDKLNRVFTKNQVDMLLLRKRVIRWTADELDNFVKLGRKISKSAYLSLIQDMKLPFPCVRALENFSNQHYPGLPLFWDKPNEVTEKCLDFVIDDEPVMQEKITVDGTGFSDSAVETVIVDVDVPFIKSEFQ